MGDMGDASGQYLHGQSFTYKPLHMVTDEGVCVWEVWKVHTIYQKNNMFHYQTHVSKCTVSPKRTKILEFGAENGLLQGHARRQIAHAPPNFELTETF